MKKNIAIIAVAAAIGLSAIAPASAAMRLPTVSVENTEIITVGSHSHGGYGGGYRQKKNYRHYKPHYKPHYRPTRHTHYHCHKKWVHGYWKNVCHVARHNIHGKHHSYKYH